MTTTNGTLITSEVRMAEVAAGLEAVRLRILGQCEMARIAAEAERARIVGDLVMRRDLLLSADVHHRCGLLHALLQPVTLSSIWAANHWPHARPAAIEVKAEPTEADANGLPSKRRRMQ